MTSFHILIIGGRDSAIHRAISMNLRVTLFQLPNYLTNFQEENTERLEVFDFEDKDLALSKAILVNDSDPIDAIVSFWERGLISASFIGEELNISCNPLESVVNTLDKALLRKMLGGKNYNVHHCSVNSKEDAINYLRSRGSALVVKPIRGSGSYGVKLIECEESMREYWLNFNANNSSWFLLEEFIDGKEVSVEVVSVNGVHQVLTFTDKVVTPGPYFVEIGHIQPSNLSPEYLDELKEISLEILECIGHIHGACHLEFKINSNGEPKLIEVQTRIGGDQIWEMTEMTTGIDQFIYTFCSLLKIKPKRLAPIFKKMKIHYIQPQSGRIKRITMDPKLQENAGVVRIKLELKDKDIIEYPITNSKERFGYILAGGNSIEIITKLISEVTNSISIQYDKKYSYIIQEVDSIRHGIRNEEAKLVNGVNLTANESCLSDLSRELLSSPLGQKYHIEKNIDNTNNWFSNMTVSSAQKLKDLAIQACKSMVGDFYFDFRPLSGIHATISVILGTTAPGETIISLSNSDRGHFATKDLVLSLGRKWNRLKMLDEVKFDVEDLQKNIKANNVKLILIDRSSTLYEMDLIELTNSLPNGVIVAYDASHVLGLIFGGEFPNPLTQNLDVVFGNTHKSFPGPQKGMIMARNNSIFNKICFALDSYLVSSQHTSSTIALYMCILEMKVFGGEYSRNIINNAQIFDKELRSYGFSSFQYNGNQTQTGTILIYCEEENWPEVLESNNIFIQTIKIENIKYIRIGTQFVTRLGYKGGEMIELASYFNQILRQDQKNNIKNKVINLSRRKSTAQYSF